MPASAQPNDIDMFEGTIELLKDKNPRSPVLAFHRAIPNVAITNLVKLINHIDERKHR